MDWLKIAACIVCLLNSIGQLYKNHWDMNEKALLWLILFWVIKQEMILFFYMNMATIQTIKDITMKSIPKMIITDILMA